jgi:hypothetical protein
MSVSNGLSCVPQSVKVRCHLQLLIHTTISTGYQGRFLGIVLIHVAGWYRGSGKTGAASLTDQFRRGCGREGEMPALLRVKSTSSLEQAPSFYMHHFNGFSPDYVAELFQGRPVVQQSLSLTVGILEKLHFYKRVRLSTYDMAFLGIS